MQCNQESLSGGSTHAHYTSIWPALIPWEWRVQTQLMIHTQHWLLAHSVRIIVLALYPCLGINGLAWVTPHTHVYHDSFVGSKEKSWYYYWYKWTRVRHGLGSFRCTDYVGNVHICSIPTVQPNIKGKWTSCPLYLNDLNWNGDGNKEAGWGLSIDTRFASAWSFLSTCSYCDFPESSDLALINSCSAC